MRGLDEESREAKDALALCRKVAAGWGVLPERADKCEVRDVGCPDCPFTLPKKKGVQCPSSRITTCRQFSLQSQSLKR